MKSKIKFIAWLSALAMASAIFMGCSSSDDGTGDSVNNTNGGSGNSNVEKVVWYQFGYVPANGESVINALNEYSAEKIGVEVDYKFVSGDDTSIKTMVASGSSDYDIVFTCGWFNDYIGQASKGFYADLTDALPEYAPALYDFIPEIVWEGVKVNGNIYSVPVYKDTAAEQFWIINADYVLAEDKVDGREEAELLGRALSTATPLLEKIKAYTDEYEDGLYPYGNPAPISVNKAGINGYHTGFDYIGLEALHFVGVDLDKSGATVQLFTDSDWFMNDLVTIEEWYHKGLINADAITTESEYTENILGTAQGWIGAEVTAWGAPVKDYEAEIASKYGPVLTTSGIQGSMNAIGASSSKVESSLKILQLANVDSTFRNMLAYGIEDTHWEETAEGTARLLDTESWSPMHFSVATFFTMMPVEGVPVNMWTDLKVVSDNAFASPLIGFVPNLDSITNEYAACKNVADIYKAQLLTGNNGGVGVENLVAQMEKDLNDNGLQKIIEEVQAQVDEFMASK